MKPSTTVHIPHLDGWRGLAIVAVMVGHFAGPGFGWLGSFGVMLFFVLSGRLMCQLLFIRQVALTTFFFRRFSRILPAFWLFALMMYFYSTFWAATPFHPSLDELASTVFFLRTYLPGDTTILTRQWAIGHIWSLNVEEHSYMFLAAGALLGRRFGPRAAAPVFLAASLVASLLFNVGYAVAPPSGASPWYMRSECASVGILAGATFWYLKERLASNLFARIPSLLPVISLAIATVCVAMYKYKGLDTTVAPLCLAFSVVCIDRFPGLLRQLLALKPLRWFGVCSFSLYLWQQPFFLSTLTEGTSRALAFGMSMLVGTVSFYFLEDPIRKAINKAWDGREKAPVVQALVPQGEV
jgi:peptidoglycan/LPS O-acetylase OafA/YrhL